MAYHPSAFLLAAQLLSLVFFAAFEGAEGSRVVLSSVGVLLLALVVWVVKRSPGVNWIAWVLAIMAELRKARSVTAIDTDEWAYRNTLENIRINGCSRVEVLLGDAQARGDVLHVEVGHPLQHGDHPLGVAGALEHVGELLELDERLRCRRVLEQGRETFD